MGERVTFSGNHLSLLDVANHYVDIEAALKIYFSTPHNNIVERYPGRSINDVFRQRLDEHDRSCAFILLATIEAAFRIDYVLRVQTKGKDELSRAFRELHKDKGARVRLEEEILDGWREYTSVSSRVVSDLKGALRYRHWIAHGRYWTPKLGRRYDYQGLYVLGQEVFTSFPLLGIEG